MKLGDVKNFLGKNSPAILTGLGIASLISSTVMAVRATPKAYRLLRVCNEFDGEHSAKEVVQLTWKYYIPSVVLGVTGIVCVIGAQSISLKRNAALASLYALSENTMKMYSEKVVEKLGEKKEREIRDDVAKRTLENHTQPERVLFTGRGEVLCYDVLSGRYFKSDAEKIRQIVNEQNKILLCDDFVSLNDFFYAIGLAGTKLGDEMGWRVDEGLIDISFSAQLTEDNEPCLVLDYKLVPKYI
jgi:hypothetical protein